MSGHAGPSRRNRAFGRTQTVSRGGRFDFRWLAGANHARSHLDIVLFRQTFAVNDDTVVRDGELVDPSLETEVPAEVRSR